MWQRRHDNRKENEMFRNATMTAMLLLALAAGAAAFAGEPCSGLTMPRVIGDMVQDNAGTFPLTMANGGVTVADRLAETGLELHCGNLYRYSATDGSRSAVVQVGRYTLEDTDQGSLLDQMLARGGFTETVVAGLPVYIRAIDPAAHPGFEAAMTALQHYHGTEERKKKIMAAVIDRYASYKLDATWEIGNSIFSIMADDEETIRLIARALICRPAL